MLVENHLRNSLEKTIRTFINVLPIIVGMLLLTSLVVTVFPEQISAGLFGNGDVLDTLLGASIGSIAAGHPLQSEPGAEPRVQFGQALGCVEQPPI